MNVRDGSRETAAAWDRIWSSHSYRFARVRSTRAKFKVAAAIELGMKFEPGERVLDIACGSGDNLIEAASRMSAGAHLVTIDISATALGLARNNFERAGLEVQPVRADWRGLPFRSGSIDKVMAFMAPFPAIIEEIARVLAPGGKLFMIALSSDSITSIFYRVQESWRREPFDERRNYSAHQLLGVLGQSLMVEEWRILHSGPDRPWSRMIDRSIARWLPEWGRYIMVRGAKSAAR